MPAGQYKVTVADKAGFTVTAIENDTITVRAQLPAPTIAFSEPDTEGKVTVTLSMPDQYINGSISYYINDVAGDPQYAPITFPISATAPDKYPTKTIRARAEHSDYYSSEYTEKSYTFAPSDTDFQVTVTPVSGLTGTIEAGKKVLMANLSSKNNKGTVTYEIDETRCGGFVIEGDKVYSNRQFDPIDYPLYVIATDDLNDPALVSPVAYGSAVIHIAPKQGGGDIIDGGGTTGGGGSGGGGGGGGSSSSVVGSGTSSGSTATLSSTTATKVTTNAVNAAISRAIKNNTKSATASVTIKNTKSVSAAVLKSIVATAQKASAGKGVAVTPMLVSDIVKNGKIESRLTLDPAKATLTTDLKLGVSLENKAVTNLFNKHFTNKIAVVKFEQIGTFGMPVEVAVKLDLSKLNVKTLQFYTYDTKTNIYASIATPAFFIDKSGYLHFTTTIGNNVVITDNPLTKK